MAEAEGVGTEDGDGEADALGDPWPVGAASGAHAVSSVTAFTPCSLRKEASTDISWAIPDVANSFFSTRVLTPTTRPQVSVTGPPLLPLAIPALCMNDLISAPSILVVTIPFRKELLGAAV